MNSFWVSSVFKIPCVRTRWLPLGSLPRRNSVQTGSLQTHAALQPLPHWSSPTRSYCCGNSAPALFLSLAWNPAIITRAQILSFWGPNSLKWFLHRGFKSATDSRSVKICSVPERYEVYLVGIFTCDTCCNNMAPWGRRCRQTLKVDGRVSPRLDPIKHPDVFDPFKRNAHSNLPEDSGVNTTQGQEDAK